MKMTVFIVEYKPKNYSSAISSEGYDSIDKAKAFVESRSYNPLLLTGNTYIDYEGNLYIIHEIDVR